MPSSAFFTLARPAILCILFASVDQLKSFLYSINKERIMNNENGVRLDESDADNNNDSSALKFEKVYYFDHNAFADFLNRTPDTYFKGLVSEARSSKFGVVIDRLNDNCDLKDISCLNTHKNNSKKEFHLLDDDQISIFQRSKDWYVEIKSQGHLFAGKIAFDAP